MKNTLHQEVLRLHSELVSHLTFQSEITGAEPVAPQGTYGSRKLRFQLRLRRNRTPPFRRNSVGVITAVFESVNLGSNPSCAYHQGT